MVRVLSTDHLRTTYLLVTKRVLYPGPTVTRISHVHRYTGARLVGPLTSEENGKERVVPP